MPLVARSGVGVVVGVSVIEEILVAAFVAAVTVGVGVEHATAGAERFLLAHIEVEAGTLGGVDAIVATEAVEAGCASIGESRLIGVVGTTENCKLVTVAEVVYDETARVAVVGAVSTGDVAKPAVVHALLHGEVDHGFFLAVVNSGEACEVALAIDHLELIHHLHGDILRGNFRVVGKKFLAVDENLGHFLALGCDFAVGAHFHARKTL